MTRVAHWYAIVIFLLALGYDLVVWGAAARLPDDVGKHLLSSAQREAPLVDFYMQVGGPLDQAVPVLDAWGARAANAALAEGFERIKQDPAVAMDLVFSQTWNSHHAWLKFCHWAAPALALISLLLWLRRPKKVRLMGSGRR